MLIDTHCHIHEKDYPNAEGAYTRAVEAGVSQMICVGTDEDSSARAVAFASNHEGVWASVGLHPHDATEGVTAIKSLRALLQNDTNNTIVAVGECGLDFFYDNSPREAQIEMLHAQLRLAQEFKKPVIFHVREAFADFWPIIDQYEDITGVIHSFTDTEVTLKEAISRGFSIGVNGIATFAKDKQAMYAAIPINSICLETDAPFLTPVPHRGTVNEPALLTLVATHIANLQSINLEELSQATERCALDTFSLT